MSTMRKIKRNIAEHNGYERGRFYLGVPKDRILDNSCFKHRYFQKIIERENNKAMQETNFPYNEIEFADNNVPDDVAVAQM